MFGLREAIRCGAALSDATFDELFGMTQAQWKTYYRKQATKHEMFATLALFAACEGGIRLDILPALKDLSLPTSPPFLETIQPSRHPGFELL